MKNYRTAPMLSRYSYADVRCKNFDLIKIIVGDVMRSGRIINKEDVENRLKHMKKNRLVKMVNFINSKDAARAYYEMR